MSVSEMPKSTLLIWMALLGSVLLSSIAHADPRKFQLTLDSQEASSLDADQLRRAQIFFSDIEAKLSGPIQDALAPGMVLRFTDIESDWPLRCQWNQAMGVRLGHLHGGAIEIERTFLKEILLGDAGSSREGCGYANGYRFAMATLLREIGRLYDERTRLSQDPRVQTILGSAEMGGILPSRRIGEDVSLRSPDVTEFESPQEGFVVNFERYAMDPEFACRRPTLAGIFSARLGWDPWPGRVCQVNAVVPLSQEQINDSLIRLVNLDPHRLYQVHYLFASKGEETMSRWGHAMYRLVFCAPSRKEPGPECLQDVS